MGSNDDRPRARSDISISKNSKTAAQRGNFAVQLLEVALEGGDNDGEVLQTLDEHLDLNIGCLSCFDLQERS